ncbi:hypothetical protein tinsulaeT_33710 [Thalassotalea insulae]|uniref:Peptidase M28 domain-containing protein n=1 Tax=Thalassotalea insulae TaxID=2056778 RepID=A0ABQ6H0S5_9GAMM|nr:M20/M25/M40 family metallo-hydrolase [Thalassotalea insulae]GLX80031.1 hypothetical protein tinsulaeT_33710 [Thalassotalea insulae]
MTYKLLKKSSTLALSLSLPLIAGSCFANNISLEQVTKDISYLASDDLNGRASFTQDIDKAADYISNRFKEIGLVPMAGNKDFKQSFTISQIAPVTLSVSLNGKEIADKNLAMASTMAKLHWQSAKDFTTHTVGQADNMRQVLGEINQQGGQHLVLVNPAHAKLFNGYRGYFSRGLNKLAIEHQGAIVIVLTEQETVKDIDISATTTITEQRLTNVVGVLPGQQQTNEIVLYSAHYDHLGATPSDSEDNIYNGADDDASGTTAIINLAQYFAKAGNNNRSLMFSAFTAEEIGGFGSKYFSQQLNPDDVIAMINIEMIGKPSKFGPGKVWMTGMDRSNLGLLLNQGLNSQEPVVYQDPYPEQNLFYRSDNATLARLGVPAHSFSSTQLDKDQHYHQTSDDLASLNLTSMHQVIEHLAVATQGLVDGKITPSRVDVNNVKGHGKIY